jgi:hypothetical protein
VDTGGRPRPQASSASRAASQVVRPPPILSRTAEVAWGWVRAGSVPRRSTRGTSGHQRSRTVQRNRRSPALQLTQNADLARRKPGPMFKAAAGAGGLRLLGLADPGGAGLRCSDRAPLDAPRRPPRHRGSYMIDPDRDQMVAGVRRAHRPAVRRSGRAGRRRDPHHLAHRAAGAPGDAADLDAGSVVGGHSVACWVAAIRSAYLR